MEPVAFWALRPLQNYARITTDEWNPYSCETDENFVTFGFDAIHDSSDLVLDDRRINFMFKLYC